jgi:hypothetical protein
MIAADALLRRVERTAMASCGAMAIAALAIAKGSPGPSIAVLAGGLLIATSYWSIKSGVSNLTNAMALRGDENARAPRGLIAIQLAGRYALLGLMAYVMIVRLRLHPLGLLAGASSIVAAVTVEAVRVLMKKS